MRTISPKHIATYGIENLDAGTLRHLHRFSRECVATHEKIRAECVESIGEAETVKEWDSVFAEDYAAEKQAIADIEAELARRGVRL